MKFTLPNIKLPYTHDDDDLMKLVATKLNISIKTIDDIEIRKQSIDARKKPDIYYVYTLIVSVSQNLTDKILKRNNAVLFKFKEYSFPHEKVELKTAPVVVGAGPAGLFAAYLLALEGYNPIVFERGEDVDSRHETIQKFIKTGELNLNSNISFGEGGAGTYSDGKLNTGVKDKFLRKDFILKTLVEHGADPAILYMAKPHVGTDYLIDIVKNIRLSIIELGGQVNFNSYVSEIITDNNELKSIKVVKDSVESEVATDRLILAIGHSSRDTFKMIESKGFNMESKPFAIGLRVEHPQAWINRSQYGVGNEEDSRLPVADYKMTYKSTLDRGVYTFCMCPGGYVVNASTDEGKCVTNGMSLFNRENVNANSAIIVTVKPEDFDSNKPLAGVEFQEKWEEKVYAVNNNYDLVTQDYESFYKDVTGQAFPEKRYIQESFYNVDSVETTCESALIESNLKDCLPDYVSKSIVEGIESFGRKIKGFDHPKTRLIGVETRTSSPVRIIRDDSLESNIKGVFPCGEGAGYAGGIMSAAIDGIKVCEMLVGGEKN